MKMEIHIDGAAKASDKRDRSWLDLLSRETLLYCLIHVILTDHGTHDRMDCKGRRVSYCTVSGTEACQQRPVSGSTSKHSIYPPRFLPHIACTPGKARRQHVDCAPRSQYA